LISEDVVVMDFEENVMDQQDHEEPEAVGYVL
jgi:hypothetical protein